MRLFLAIWFAALLPFAALAQDLPTPLSDTVSDFANVIGPEAEAEIAAELQRHRDETGVHMVAVTLPSQVGGRPGERIEDYATRLFNAWGVGDAERNDGLMILVIPSDRVVRIATGAGYDRVYDGRAQRVIDTTMLPAFRDSDFAGGIRDGVESARLRLIDPFVAGKPVTEDEGFPQQRGAWGWIAAAVAAIGGLSIFAGPKIYRYYKTCPQCQQPTLNRRREV
ncbi:MAG: TPM domain-containing protein, partial [Paracoccaceae bacterium]